MQDNMLAEMQGWCRGCRGGAGGAGMVQGRCRWCRGGVQATCTVCTSASIVSGAGRCRGCRHTSASGEVSLAASVKSGGSYLNP